MGPITCIHACMHVDTGNHTAIYHHEEYNQTFILLQMLESPVLRSLQCNLARSKVEIALLQAMILGRGIYETTPPRLNGGAVPERYS